ncbi:MAG: energy transducer TonB [Bacteroidota bacterium]
MIEVLNTLGIAGLVFLFFALLIAIIFCLKFFIRRKAQEIQQKRMQSNPLEKKFVEVDIHRYRGIIANIGLALSIAVVLSAFEFPDFEEKKLVIPCNLNIIELDTMMTKITIQERKRPPKVKTPIIEEVKDEELVEDIDVAFDEPDENGIIKEVIVEEEPEEIEVVPDFVDFAEESASPIGGMQAFFKYVKKHIKYPSLAKRTGVQGKVYVQFIVDTDGTLTEVKTMRGIGSGCDEEAVRIVANAPKWNPGKQRGRPVRQRIVLPIHFVLGN